VEAPDPVTLVGVRVQVKPVAGLTVEVRLTNPLKPCWAVIVIVEVPEAFAETVTLVGLAVIVKSWTVYVTVAERARLPLVPVTVTVYVPALPEQESVDAPEVPSDKLVGVCVQVRPVDGDSV
jgi:hypothetical protein